MAILIDLHEALRVVREKRGIQQQQLAEKLHISASALCRYETGSRSIPDDVLADIICYLHAPEIANARCNTCPVAAARAKMSERRAA